MNEIVGLLENFQKEESVENTYNLIKYFRINGQFKLCKLFYSTLEIDHNPQSKGYRLRLLYEYSIFAWYLGTESQKIVDVFMELFQSGKFDNYSLLGNYKFYQPILKCERSINISSALEKEINGNNYSFVGSNPSIIPLDKGSGCYLINLRFVRYSISPNGTYPWIDCYATLNKRIIVKIPPDKFEIQVLSEQLLEENGIHQFNGCSYYGVEDIKLFDTGEKVLFTGTYINEHIYTVWGYYPLTGRECNPLTGETELIHRKLDYPGCGNQKCEKNWVFVPGQGTNLVMIYSWHPLVIGTIEQTEDNSIFKEIKRIDTSPFFRDARGSTNGYLFNDEIWFIVHFIHKLDNRPRDYFHAFVILDMVTLNVKSYSAPFKFNQCGNEIEYCLGLVVEHDNILVTHSVWDRESYIKIYSKSYIDSLMYQQLELDLGPMQHYNCLKYHYEEAIEEIEQNVQTFKQLTSINPPVAKFSRSYYQSILNLNPDGEKIYDFCFIGSIESNHTTRQWVIDFAKEHFTIDSVFVCTDPEHQSLGPFDKTNDPLFKGWYNPKRNHDNGSKQVQYRVVSENEMYFKTMSQSKYILCPAGDSSWSFRFYETLMCKSTPIVESWHHTYRTVEESKIGYRYINASLFKNSTNTNYNQIVLSNTKLFEKHNIINFIR